MFRHVGGRARSPYPCSFSSRTAIRQAGGRHRTESARFQHRGRACSSSKRLGLRYPSTPSRSLRRAIAIGSSNPKSCQSRRPAAARRRRARSGSPGRHARSSGSTRAPASARAPEAAATTSSAWSTTARPSSAPGARAAPQSNSSDATSSSSTSLAT